MAQSECSKAAFETKQEANARISGIKGSAHNGSNILTKAYKCEFCGKWHLTSKDSRSRRAKKEMKYSNKPLKYKKYKSEVYIKPK